MEEDKLKYPLAYEIKPTITLRYVTEGGGGSGVWA
jgi:hypothetical protein